MKPVVGWEGLYSATEDGQVWSERSQKFLKVRSDHESYLFVELYKEGRGTIKKIHRLVCEAYHGPCPEGCECLHLDGDRTNNHASNLRWDKHTVNCRDLNQARRVVRGDGEIFDSIGEAAESVGVTRKGIERALAGKQKTSGGHTWSYADDKPPEKLKRKPVKRNDGRLFESVGSAARSVDGDYRGISLCCRGKVKTYKGYSWEYLAI